MILSNIAILDAIQRGALTIVPLAGTDPSASPFNTSAVDLRLGTEILLPKADQPLALDLRKKGISLFLKQHCHSHKISEHQPFTLTQPEVSTPWYKRFPRRSRRTSLSISEFALAR